MIFIYHTSRSTSRQLQRLGLGLVSDAKRLVSVSELCISGLVSVSSRTKCPTSRSRLGLGHLRLGSRLGLGLKGLVHIPAVNYYFTKNLESLMKVHKTFIFETSVQTIQMNFEGKKFQSCEGLCHIMEK